MWLYFEMTAMRSQHAFWRKLISSHWHHLWCLWTSDWLCIVAVSSSEIIQFDWLALTSFLPCSWPSFTSWLCSISPSLPLGRATLPSLVRTHGSQGKSIYPSVVTPLWITPSNTPVTSERIRDVSILSEFIHSLRFYRRWLYRDIHRTSNDLLSSVLVFTYFCTRKNCWMNSEVLRLSHQTSSLSTILKVSQLNIYNPKKYVTDLSSQNEIQKKNSRVLWEGNVKNDRNIYSLVNI